MSEVSIIQPTTSKAKAKTATQIHTSLLLQHLIESMKEETFTLEWLLSSLPKNSFGIVILFLALISLFPVVSVISRILIIILASQIILGYQSPKFPRRFRQKPLPARYLVHLDRHAIPALTYLERAVKPRWPRLLVGTRRVTAFVALILTALSLIAPIPLANMPPAVIGTLMALAYIEHDGLLLSLALGMALGLLAGVVLLFV